MFGNISILKYCNLLIIAAICIIAFGCECVPGLDTPKKYLPNTISKVAFVNNLTDNSSYKLYSNSIEIANSSSDINRTIDYVETYSGENYIQLLETSNKMLFSGLFNFTKDANYSLISYKNNNRIHLIAIEDSASNEQSPQLRVINLAASSRTIVARISDSEPIELKNRAFTPLFRISPIATKIEIIDPETNNLLVSEVVNIENEILYNIMYFQANSDNFGTLAIKKVKK